MPYSLPSTPVASSGPTSPTLGGQGRAGHRRSYLSVSGADYFSSPSTSGSSGRGAFSSLGSLPRRTPPATPKRSVFHFNDDESSVSDDEPPVNLHNEDDDDERGPPRPVKLNPRSSMHMNLTVNLPRPTLPQRVRPGIPFPRTTSPGPGLPSPTITTASPAPFSPAPPVIASSNSSGSTGGRPMARPIVNRTTSSPLILLSNGKPLKSSLKSSSSSPSIFHPPHLHLNNDKTHLFPPASPFQGPAHIRAASAPASPGEMELASLSTSGSADSLPTTPKNVHFASRLENVKLFSRLAKPAALLESAGEDAPETEDTEDTDGDSAFGYDANVKRVGMRRRYSTVSGAGYPFPKFLAPAEAATSAKSQGDRYIIAPHPSSSQIPASLPSPFANVHMEAVNLSHVLPTDGVSAGTDATPGNTTLTLSGHVLVRNLAFSKAVAVRFTLDGWQTTSEVGAKYVDSMSQLPLTSEANVPSASASAPKESWDRFAFTINLADYAHMLGERTVWMVARYAINDGQDEWWDNNSGRNYKVVFSRGQAAGNDAVNGVNVRRSRGLSAPAVPSLPSKAFTIGPGAAQQLAIPPYMGAPAQPMFPGGATSEFRNATIATTRERLAKLNLRNYAAPGRRAIPQVPAIDTTPPSPPSFAPSAPTTSPAPPTNSPAPSLVSSDSRSSPSASDDEDEGEVTTPDGTATMPIPDVHLAGKHAVEFPRVEEETWARDKPWLSGSPPVRSRVNASLMCLSPEKQPPTPHPSEPSPRPETHFSSSITTLSSDGNSATASAEFAGACLATVPDPSQPSSTSDLDASRTSVGARQSTEERSNGMAQGDRREAGSESEMSADYDASIEGEKTLAATLGGGSPSAYEAFLKEWCFARGPSPAGTPKGVEGAEVGRLGHGLVGV